jgi:hypothetical protein
MSYLEIAKSVNFDPDRWLKWTPKGAPMQCTVELHKDGDRMGIRTNATNEDSFIRALSEALDVAVRTGRFQWLDEEASKKACHDVIGSDWEFQFGYWLRNAVDICCKLRGYKSTVEEQRILVAGSNNAFTGDEETLVAQNEVHEDKRSIKEIAADVLEEKKAASKK